VNCALSTNSENILAAARATFRQVLEPSADPALTLRFWVDPAAQTRPPWPQPYFRGLGHLVYAGFDAENSLLLDLRGRHVIGRFSAAMAADEGYWRRVVFPTAVGLASERLGITTLHCACVEIRGNGLLLAGGSGSGKSTLSVAVARCGFAFLSDDWTYFLPRDGRLYAWGLNTPVKLLPEAVHYFPELQGLAPGISPNGELAYEVDPQRLFRTRPSLCCEPRWVIFLERQRAPRFDLTELPSHEAAARLESDLEDLPAELSQITETHLATIAKLVERPCWLLRYAGEPQAMARALAQFCADSTA
jgi:hypothetical protein